jgi:hypothetical protein
MINGNMIKQPNYFVTEVVLINYVFTGGRKKAALISFTFISYNWWLWFAEYK